MMSVAQPKRRCFVTMCLAGSFGKRYIAIRCLPSSSVSEVFVCEITVYCQLHCSRLCFSMHIFETRAGRYDCIYRATVEMCPPGEIWLYRLTAVYSYFEIQSGLFLD